MQNISIYINQKASHSKEELKTAISRVLFRSELQFRTPSNLEEMDAFLDEDIKNKVDAIVSVGGDGTANSIIQKLADTDIGLLVVPGGTANDLAQELGNHKRLSSVAQSIRNQEFKKIDLIKVNGRYMATNGGIGLGGRVAQKINRLRTSYPRFKKVMELSGSKIYSMFVAQELLSLDFETYKLKIQSKELSGVFQVPALFINNQPKVGGKFEVAPFTTNTDGKFNVILLTHQNRAQLINCVLKVSLGQIPMNDPNFITFETDKLTIENLSDDDSLFFGDGEVLSSDQKWNIEVAKNSLKVFTRRAIDSHLPLPQNFGLS